MDWKFNKYFYSFLYSGAAFLALAQSSLTGSDANNSSSVNSTVLPHKPDVAASSPHLSDLLNVNSDMLLRMTYVLLGLTLLIVLYFVIKLCRTKRKTTSIRRYDVLSAQKLQSEYALDVDDSEEEDEVYDDSHKSLVKSTRPEK